MVVGAAQVDDCALHDDLVSVAVVGIVLLLQARAALHRAAEKGRWFG